MSCCGQHRDSMRAPVSLVPPAQVAPTLATVARPRVVGRGSMWNHASLALNGRSVHLRYRERAPMRVRGPVTGRHYEFSAAQPIQAVDTRDADGLLRTRMFLRAG